MESLRQAYHNKKIYKNKITSEAAIKWLEKNVILINEKIDRKTVSRLIDNIQNFENTFGDYKDKLPTISNYLDSAETGLRMVITGQTTDKKTSNMLEQLTYLYSLFSDFFTRDLPVLLRTNLFDSAKENPDIKLNQLRIQTAGRFDIETVRNALTNAIKPSKEEKRLLGRIYRSTALPKLNAEAIASEMMNLTYNDLEGLTKVGKVPMAVADSKETKEDDLPEGTVRNLSKESANKTKYITPEIAEQVLKKAADISTINENLIKEAKLITEVEIAEIKPAIGSIKKLANTVEALEPLQDPINDLQSKVLETLADGNVKSWIVQAAQSRNPISLLKNLFSTPKGKILAQANMAIETLKNAAKAWKEIQPLLDQDSPSKKDIANIKKILSRSILGGSLGKIASVFKTQPFPGLSPQEIVDALSQPLDEYLEIAVFENKANNSKTLLEQNEENEALQALEKFKTGMEQLTTAMKSKGGATPTKSTSGTEPTKDTEATTPSTPTGKGSVVGKEPFGGESDVADTAKAITTAFKGKLKPNQINQLTSILSKQGYKIVKK